MWVPRWQSIVDFVVLLDAATLVAVVLLLVVFQHELCRALLRLDILVQRWRWRWRVEPLEPAFIALSEAVFALARSGRGALLVIVRRDSTEDLITGGVPLGGEISKEIIETIFRKVSPVMMVPRLSRTTESPGLPPSSR